MAYSVSSAWIDELIDSAPANIVRKCMIGSSDYTDWVLTWPKIRRTMNDLKSVDITILLGNVDGHLNDFYTSTYSIVQSVQLEFGFTISGSDELVDIYNGHVKAVKYEGTKVSIQCKDRLWDLSSVVVGESEETIVFSDQIPSDIAWDLCTCYGGLDNTKGAGNVDIDWPSFEAWAEQFSNDSLSIEAIYDGQKITESLQKLAEFTDSAMWIDASGKLKFERLTEASSLDLLLGTSDFLDFKIDVNSLRLINKQYVEAKYSVESDYWEIAVYNESSNSVNSFGLYEDLMRDEHVWFMSSAGAMNLAQRKILKLDTPPVLLEGQTGLKSLQMEMNDTIRVVDSFYGIGSDDAWRITEYGFNMHTGEIDMSLDGATALGAFILDIDYLDGPKALL